MKISFCHFILILFITIQVITCFSCLNNQDTIKTHTVTVFFAACFSPMMDALRTEAEQTLKIQLRTEVSGSQVALRKVTELNRECDLLMIADNFLFKEIASSHCPWRIDFAHDEVVLGVGIRAQHTDEAEQNWIPVLLKNNIHLGRVDENLSPIGYRTLLAWRILENSGYPDLMMKLKNKTEKVVDHVVQLATLLKAGDVDYGFIYRTTCIQYDIRYISLDKKINFGNSDTDYSNATISLSRKEAERERHITFHGSPIIYSLSIPTNAPAKEKAVEFIRFILLSKTEQFIKNGFLLFKPIFYGKKNEFVPFADFADYGGDF